jgi:hypothetical protein
MVVECGFILLDFVEDETLPILGVDENVETPATQLALK